MRKTLNNKIKKSSKTKANKIKIFNVNKINYKLNFILVYL